VKPFEEETVNVKVWTHHPPITHLSPSLCVALHYIIIILLPRTSVVVATSDTGRIGYQQAAWQGEGQRRRQSEDRTAAAAEFMASRGTGGGRRAFVDGRREGRVFDDGRTDAAVDIEFRARSYLRRRNRRRRRISRCHRALSSTPPHRKRAGQRVARENKHDATFVITYNIFLLLLSIKLKRRFRYYKVHSPLRFRRTAQ